MPTRSEQDYILRQLRAVAEAIARALGARGRGDHVAEQQSFAAAWGELLGPLAPVARGADAHTVASLIGDARRTLAASDLVAAQADGVAARQGDPAAASERRRATALLIEAAARDPNAPGLADAAQRLLAHAESAALGAAERSRLATLAASATTRAPDAP
jgi:hypothetical protein